MLQELIVTLVFATDVMPPGSVSFHSIVSAWVRTRADALLVNSCLLVLKFAQMSKLRFTHYEVQELYHRLLWKSATQALTHMHGMRSSSNQVISIF